MDKLVKGIHHVALKCQGVEAFEKTVRFYRDVLKMDVVRSWGEGTGKGAMLDTGSGVIEIFADAQDQREQGAIRHFALATDDVDACAKAVEEAGYQVFVEPKDAEIPSDPVYRIRIAFCIGPVGEEIEFFQVRE